MFMWYIFALVYVLFIVAFRKQVGSFSQYKYHKFSQRGAKKVGEGRYQEGSRFRRLLRDKSCVRIRSLIH